MTATTSGSTERARAARRLWQHIEPVHAVVYFAPEVADGFAESGLRGWWSGYFAGRAAPLGECGPELVEALFYGFAAGRVQRAVPYVWTVLTPRAAIELRQHRVSVALARVLGPGSWSEELARVAELLERAVEGAQVAGRGLYAANRSLEWPEDPLARVWHGCTLLREHRGDGHNALLVQAGLGGAAANRLAAGAGLLRGDEDQRVNRGWDEQEWSAAGEELRSRGWLDARGGATTEGLAQRAAIDQRTDEVAAGPVAALGDEGLRELIYRLAPMVAAVVGSGTVGYPNPIGLTPSAG